MNLKILSNKLSKELGVSADLIEKVGRSQFKLVEETIREGKLETVYIKYLGRFGIKPQRLKHFPKDKQDVYYGKQE